MSNFEDSMKSHSVSGSKNDPAATDLDYYSKPENYTGSSLQAFQRFVVDKNKEERNNLQNEKKRVVKDAKYYFFNRYKHILKDVIFLDDIVDLETEESSEEEEEEVDIKGKDARKSGGKTPAADILKTITEEGDDADRKEAGLGAKSRASMSPEKSVGAVHSGMTDERMTPDSGTFTPLGSKKRSQAVLASPTARQSTALQRLQMDKAAKEIRAKQLKEKFVSCVKVIKAIVRLSASAKGKQASSNMTSMRTFMDIASEETTTEENMKNAGLSFDPSYFKAKKEISLSSETKAILTTASEDRTQEQVQTAMFGLQCLRSYAEYPLHMQEKLAKVAWYEIVAPKSIIIRQGHFAENFYFILSGHAVVTILLKDPKTGASFVKTATVMKKGMSFGELALLHHSKRTATVTSQDTVQLLSIGREDFFDIFMSGEEGDLPDHIKFISNLDFMKDWPIEKLAEHPEHCLLHFFKRNTSIVANSNNSEWMYIVKSGSCVVLKKLKGVTASAYMAKPKANDNNISPAKMKAVIFAPKVDSGLRKRKPADDNDKEKAKENTAEETKEDADDTKFTKEKYSQQPQTKKAHFSTKSSFDKRKRYEPPSKCVPKKREATPEPTPAETKPGPVFVQVSIMKPRDVFGLDSIQFEDDIQRSHTEVSLVSRGAECIMLSKAFYAKHANEAVKKRVRESVRAYPAEDVFQENLQIKEDWIMYKKVLLNDLTCQLREYANRFGS
ncbi:cyclic nucleotide-binding domain-containing protein 2-like [Mercenaria mercenaria]|uniref:cyclic nucleotide-binding domain-containing protein 2-like n=1 Tax=Mercenaria mercenaria TaxID=6596 RepID=UPI00234F1B5E|nr:cyclic nucleotide-binding domain-containing protein 2-like [Mercenaria mercenaria]